MSLALDLVEAPDFDAEGMDSAGEEDPTFEVTIEPGLDFNAVVFPGYRIINLLVLFISVKVDIYKVKIITYSWKPLGSRIGCNCSRDGRRTNESSV